MKRMIKTLMLAATLLSMAACSEPVIDVTTTITDAFDRTVTYKEEATQRVVCLGAGALRMYSYVGDLTKLVGIEKIDAQTFGVGTAIRPYYHVNKDFFQTLPIVGEGGPMNQAPNMTALAAVNPTMVITCYSNMDHYETISQGLNIPVIGIKQGSDGPFSEDFAVSMSILSIVFHRTERVASLLNDIADYKDELWGNRPTDGEKSAYMGCIGNWGKTNAYGTMANNPIFNYAGVENISDNPAFKGDSKAQYTITKANLLDANPSKIFFDAAGYAGFKADYDEHPEDYSALDAFKNGELYMVLPYKAYDGNLEIQIMSTYFLQSVMYPEQYEGVDLVAKYNQILTSFVGKACYNEFSSYSTWLGGYGKISLE